MPRSRPRRPAVEVSQRDLMLAAAAYCRSEACQTMREAAIGGDLYLRLGAVAAAIDDLMELPEMTGDRGRLRPGTRTAGQA